MWAFAGADRIVELGCARTPRPGFTHDGTHGLVPLVRLVGLERGLAELSPYAIGHDPAEHVRYRYVLD